MKFQVTYQRMPYNYTQAAGLVVEADDKAEAYVTAVDHLTNAGHVMNFSDIDHVLTEEEAKKVGAQFAAVYPTTSIRGIVEYKPQVRGKVLQG